MHNPLVGSDPPPSYVEAQTCQFAPGELPPPAYSVGRAHIWRVRHINRDCNNVIDNCYYRKCKATSENKWACGIAGSSAIVATGSFLGLSIGLAAPAAVFTLTPVLFCAGYVFGWGVFKMSSICVDSTEECCRQVGLAG